VVNASVVDVVIYYVPYYIAVMASLNWLSKGLFIPVLNDVAQLVAAWPVSRAAALGLLSRGPHKFSVTAKGGDRSKIVVQWPLMWPFAIAFGLTFGGLLVTLNSDFTFNYTGAAGDGIVVVLFWTIYNLLVLLVAIAACIERPRLNSPLRQVVQPVTLHFDGHEQRGWLISLGVEGGRISGPSGLAAGAAGTVTLPLIGEVAASVVAPTREGYQIKLDPTPEQRDRIIAKLHTHRVVPGTDRGDLGLMIRELARSLTR
jgi:cellulose synthase (UDP-forming)